MSHSTSDAPRGRIDLARALADVTHVSFASPSWRSPLERAAARRLTRYGVTWHYEEHRFTLDDGQVYTPDLWLPQIGVFIEVKGDKRPERLDKPARLAWQLDPRNAWHDDEYERATALDEWWELAGDYKDLLCPTGPEDYLLTARRRVPQVWIWTQTRLYHGGYARIECDERRGYDGRCAAGCCSCRSYWVTCAACAQAQPHCSAAPRVCRRCGGATATLDRYVGGNGIESEVRS